MSLRSAKFHFIVGAILCVISAIYAQIIMPLWIIFALILILEISGKLKRHKLLSVGAEAGIIQMTLVFFTIALQVYNRDHIMFGILFCSIGLISQCATEATNGWRMPAAVNVISECKSPRYVKINHQGAVKTRLNWLGDWIPNGNYLVSPGDILIDIVLYTSAIQFFFFW